jgi:hypothetical protein
MPRTADFPDQVATPRLSPATESVDDAAALDAAVDVLEAHTAPGDARLPVEAPVAHRRLERRFKGWDQRAQLLHGETGQIQDLHGAGLDLGTPSISPGDGLPSLEAKDTINRDQLF